MEEPTFLFARFNDRSTMDHVLEELSTSPGVEEWMATEGFFQLVLAAEGDSTNLVSRLKSGNADEVAVCKLVKSERKKISFNQENEYSCFLIDAQPEQVDKIRGAIERTGVFDQVFQAVGPYNLIALAGAAEFDELDRVANDRLPSMDGVLRIRQLRIIKSWMR